MPILLSMCYHLCYVRSKFKKVFTIQITFHVREEVKKMETISDKKMKVNEQDSEDTLMISKIKKGVAWGGEGIVIKIF